MADDQARIDDPGTVVVHASLRGLVGAVSAPVILLTLGIAAVAGEGGLRVVPAVLVASGAILGVIVALDYPRCARFDAAGITRVCLLREHHLPWSAIVALERTRRGTFARARRLGSRRDETPAGSGGLVARGTGRGRWLLTDRVEGAFEYDRLRRLLTSLDVPTVLRATRPADTTPPSRLSRTRRRPDDRPDLPA